MHVRFGQRGVAITGPLCHLVSYIVVAVHPPYPVLVVMFIFVGFGNGLIDAAWCAWLGNMANANEVQGFLQASYSLGATVSPLIATALIEKSNAGWYGFYYIMVSRRLEMPEIYVLTDCRSLHRPLSSRRPPPRSGNRLARCMKPRIRATQTPTPGAREKQSNRK